MIDWGWIGQNVQTMAGYVGEHVVLSVIPIVIGLVLALPIGYLVSLTGPVANGLLAVWGIIYAIPSLALFVVIPGIFAISILSPLNVVIALSIYAVALLVRSVVDGLRSVPDEVKQSSTAVGYGYAGRLFRIELPLALPVIFAGLRVVTVSNVSLVTVGALIGVGGLGVPMLQGFNQFFYTPVILAIVLVVVVALVFDGALLLLRRLVLPWTRRGLAA